MADSKALDKSIRDTLNKIENMVVSASHLPLTDKALVDDNDLVHHIEDLRRDLPAALDEAAAIVNKRDAIIGAAEREAADMRKKAEDYARKITNEQEVVKQAEEQARAILEQAQTRARELLEVTQKNAAELQLNADNYANQVFDQLINHVNGTFNGVRQAEAGMQQAVNVLMQAKQQMNNQAQAQRERERETLIKLEQEREQEALAQREQEMRAQERGVAVRHPSQLQQ